MNKLLKWLVFGIVLLGLVLFGLVAYSQQWFQKDLLESILAEKKTVGVDSVGISISSSQGWIDNISENKIKIALGKEKNNKFEEWKITLNTTGACLIDLYLDENGEQKRFSDTNVVFENAESKILKSGWAPIAMVEHAKVGQPVLVFGDLSTMTAKTIYFYKDTCP